MNRRTRQLRASLLLLILSAATCAFAPAGYAADNTLKMGIVPRRSVTETEKAFTPLTEYLAKNLGRPVSLVTFKTFESFWKAVQARRFDVVLYNQYHYIRSAADYHVIAHIEEAGRSTISGVIYVRKDSGITDLAQLKGRTIIFGGGEDAMVSYISTSALLRRAGLRKSDFKPLFAVNPPNALVALIHRQADAAGAGDTVPDLPEVSAAINANELTQLAKSMPLLQLPITVRRSMPAELRSSVQSLLVELKNNPSSASVLKAAGLTGFDSAEDKDYDPQRKIVAEVFNDGDGKPRTNRK